MPLIMDFLSSIEKGMRRTQLLGTDIDRYAAPTDLVVGSSLVGMEGLIVK